MEHWYALYTKPHCEHQVTTILEQRKIDTYLPEIETLTAQGKREKRPFFPCYLFTHVDFEIIDLTVLQWTPGLRYIVSCDQHPVPVPDEIIEFFRSKVSLASTQPACPFKAGDVVRITSGPLQDMLAVFDRSSTPGERVQVLLAVLGHLSRAQVSITALEMAPPGTAAPGVPRPRRTRGRGRYIKSNEWQAV